MTEEQERAIEQFIFWCGVGAASGCVVGLVWLAW